MISSRIEKVIFAFVWYVAIIFLRVIIPIDIVDSGTRIQYILVASIITTSIVVVYLYMRDHYVQTKIMNYYFSNDYDSCHAYIDHCMGRQKKLLWLKNEKAILFALSGNISDFYAYILELNPPKKLSNTQVYRIQMFKDLFAYLTNGTKITYIDDTDEKSSLRRLLNCIAIYKSDSEEILSTALNLYNAKENLYKSISSMIIALIYESRGDECKYELYKNKALEHAPSPEIRYCLQEKFEKKQI